MTSPERQALSAFFTSVTGVPTRMVRLELSSPTMHHVTFPADIPTFTETKQGFVRISSERTKIALLQVIPSSLALNYTFGAKIERNITIFGFF